MIPAEQIENVRRSHDLVAFIEAAGVKLRRQGSSYMGLCPFHPDKSPSLAVSADKQYWCCHGACSANGKRAGGDVIEFARRLWGLSFPEALKRLGADLPVAAPRPPRAAPTRHAAPRPGNGSRPNPKLLEQVMSCYHQGFLSSLPVKDYLVSRGITSAELLAVLPVGYADGSLSELAPVGSDTHAALLAAGVLSTPRRELFSGCVVFPLRDLEGRIVNLYGRGIADDRHCYLPGARRGLFNAACAATAEELLITESVIDALSFLQAGIPNAVPIYGTNGWTKDHDALLEKHRIRRVVLALDSDVAGEKAAEALAEKLRSRGLEVHNVLLPAKDPNEMLVREGPEGFAATWRKLLAPPAEPASKEAAKEESSPAPSLKTEDGAYVIAQKTRTYTVRGLSPMGVDRLRVNVRVEQEGRFHVDTLDLYAARARKAFLEASAEALSLSPDAAGELGQEMNAVIELLEKERLRLRKQAPKDDKPAMSEPERKEALDYLRAPGLMDRLKVDLKAAGSVGEETVMLIGYLVGLSRKQREPLAVLFCARSGAGKSNLQDRICDFVPPEDLVKYTRVTGQAFFYKEENALVHKVVAIDEEAGASDAAYALRNLQSAGYLSVSATRTDPQTGKLKADDYRVNGPTAIFLTTAHPEALDYETRNRFILLTVNESKEQTKAILEWQRWSETLEGVLARKKRDEILTRHHNMQRLLKPLEVVNPLAQELRYPAGWLILRREQKKYLALIKAVALLHQYQRPRKSAGSGSSRFEYIEVSQQDIDIATELAKGILRRNLDELAPPTRTLLHDIQRLVAAKMKKDGTKQHRTLIDRREIQKATGLSLWQLRVYLAQLVEYEYLASVRGCQGKRYMYVLLWEGEEEDPASEVGNVPT